jgi:hypothetical protein
MEEYRTTLEDYKEALMSCRPQDWESISFYKERIEYYENKLKETEEIED